MSIPLGERDQQPSCRDEPKQRRRQHGQERQVRPPARAGPAQHALELRTYPVIRDPVTDVSVNYGWALEVTSFTPPDGLKPGGYRMAQDDVDRSREFRRCIECWLCQDVCHVIRDHDDNKPAYAGPRYFIRHAELDMHPLDARDLRAVLHEEQGLGLCNITKCCTEVCPAGIKITDNVIIPVKERSADQRYDPLGRLVCSWRRREGRSPAG